MKTQKINMNKQSNNNQFPHNPLNSPKDTKRKKDRKIIYAVRDTAYQLRGMNNGIIPSDTMGSYTGTAYDGGKPEQDADDL